MRQARNGGLLIEVQGDPARVEAVKADIVRMVDAEAEVRSFQQRELIIVKDFDE